jgi:hypothetical protein
MPDWPAITKHEDDHEFIFFSGVQAWQPMVTGSAIHWTAYA